MEQEKIIKITRILSVVFLLCSLLFALFPCISFKEDLVRDMVTEAGGSEISYLLNDSTIAAITQELNGGLTGNLVRSSVAILGIGVVTSYSNSMFLTTIYFLLLIVGIPVLSGISAGFQVWGKDGKKLKLSLIFTIVCVCLSISLFIVVPGFLWNLFEKAVSDIGAAWGTSANLSIYSAPMKLLIFQIMVRVLSVGFWGFFICQILALICIIVRYIKENGFVKGTAMDDQTASQKSHAHSPQLHAAKKGTGNLFGVTGGYSGAEIPVDAAGIVVGRDAALSQLVIDAPKISRKHCQIIYDGIKNQYIVTDYSTNGTYAGNRRLSKGVAEILPPGTLIYVGDDRNTFRLQ